jgi:hypothetical protein
MVLVKMCFEIEYYIYIKFVVNMAIGIISWGCVGMGGGQGKSPG